MSGHANHKSTSIKPNVNASNLDLEPKDPQPESGYPYNAEEETRQSAPATERVKDKPQDAPEEA